MGALATFRYWSFEGRLKTYRGSVDKVQSPFEMQENTLELFVATILQNLGIPSVRTFSQGEKRVFVPREASMKCVGAKRFRCLVGSGQRHKSRRKVSTAFVLLLTAGLAAFLFPASANAAVATQEQPQGSRKYPLGSLSATGEVYVNDKPVPVESTVFPGDTVRTGANSTAVFTMTSNGTLKIGAETQVALPGEPQFAAELQSGTAVIDSLSGPSGIKVRVGGIVVVPAVRSRVTSAKIERQADGTFLVTCLDGDIGTLSLQGTAGRLLEAGQGVSVTPSGQMVVQKQSGGTSVSSGMPGPLKGKSGWTLLGLAGGGAGVAAVVLGHGGKPPVSPSGP